MGEGHYYYYYYYFFLGGGGVIRKHYRFKGGHVKKWHADGGGACNF